MYIYVHKWQTLWPHLDRYIMIDYDTNAAGLHLDMRRPSSNVMRLLCFIPDILRYLGWRRIISYKVTLDKRPHKDYMTLWISGFLPCWLFDSLTKNKTASEIQKVRKSEIKIFNESHIYVYKRVRSKVKWLTWTLKWKRTWT